MPVPDSDEPGTEKDPLRSVSTGERVFSALPAKCPRQDSNLRTRLRRPMLYPLSYGGDIAALGGDE